MCINIYTMDENLTLIHRIALAIATSIASRHGSNFFLSELNRSAIAIANVVPRKNLHSSQNKCLNMIIYIK